MSGTTDNEQNAKRDFHQMVSVYLDKLKTNPEEHVEMEVRFGKNNWTGRNISKIDYDNVIHAIKSHGFTCNQLEGRNHLRISCENVNPASGMREISNIRADIVGADLIRDYCETNSIQALLDKPSTSSAFHEKIKFTQKSSVVNYNNKPVNMVHFNDFNFRVDIKTEHDFSVHSRQARNIISSWMDSKKRFRHLNRVQFRHPDYPILVDLSIIRSSGTLKGVPVPKYTVQEAKLFTNPPSYEIELEIDNERIKSYNGKKAIDHEQLMTHIRKCIRIVLGALQDSMYPIGNIERERIATEYMKLIHGEQFVPRKNRMVFASDFIGPSPVTLQLENVCVPDGKSTLPNIRVGYSVTEKADGERKLMYISSEGKIYLINTGMQVAFMGCKTDEKGLFNTLLDGEHIQRNRYGAFINLYAAFDVYYIHKKSVREYAFMKTDEEASDNKYRLLLLNRLVKMISPKSMTEGGCPIRIECKEFHISTENYSIFQCCATVMSKMSDKLFEYETDGLIFTPLNMAVGASSSVVPNEHTKLPKTKRTWEWAFKWKPPHFNTIDFLVSSKLDKSGNPEIHTMVDHGLGVKQYRIFVLRCGYSRKNDGYLQPWQDILDDRIAKLEEDGTAPEEDKYFPTQFIPTNPYDVNAGYCNVNIVTNGTGTMDTFTEAGENFKEDMIVEFKYDLSREGAWRWVPLRVRYDKTMELLSGGKEYGNAFKTANSNWRSIHYPITEMMLATGDNIPELLENDEVYYKDVGDETMTQGLRDFHNRYIKRNLILSVSRRNNTLIDFAVGRAGDLPKWKDANLNFVFGIDVSPENINNRKSGACARYLDMCQTNTDMPGALFLHGNSALNIRDGSAFTTDKEKMVTKAVFGTGPKDRNILGAGVYKHFGVGREGFNVSSVQFALHYFFENEMTLHSFMRNVAECTKLGGYFIGTCYDGKSVFKLLADKMRGESVVIMKSGKKIFEITKKYDETGFPDDAQSIGYAIDVFQESINKTFQEYLVNFEYLTRLMENYGFTLVNSEEATKTGLPNGTGMFRDMYLKMMDEIKLNPKVAKNYRYANTMTEEEKRISFMNRYFVFRKVAQVQHPEKMAKYISEYSSSNSTAIQENPEDEFAEIEGIAKLKPTSPPVAATNTPTPTAKPIRRISKNKFLIRDSKPKSMSIGQPISGVVAADPNQELDTMKNTTTIQVPKTPSPTQRKKLYIPESRTIRVLKK